MELKTRNNYATSLYTGTLLIILMGAVVAGLGVFLLFPHDLGQDYHSSLAAVQAMRKALFWKVAVLYAVAFLLVIASIVTFHLFYSHRIAGPAYRIGRQAERIAEGNLTDDIIFRHKDNLTDIKDALNDMAAQYRERFAAVNDSLALIEMQAKAVFEIIEQGKTEDVRQKIEIITGNLSKIEQSLLELKV